jgi:hypothetical protein
LPDPIYLLNPDNLFFFFEQEAAKEAKKEERVSTRLNVSGIQKTSKLEKIAISC